MDYRLAPETPFPGSLEDNYAGLKWLYDNASELGVDRARIAVMGESAGGGHAAMLAIAARDRGEVPLVDQALIYPMLDDRTGSTRAVLRTSAQSLGPRRRIDSDGVHVVPGAFHGFDGARDATVSKQFRAALLGALRRAFDKA